MTPNQAEGFKDFLYQRNYKPKTAELFRLYVRRLHAWLEEQDISLQGCSYPDILAYLKKLKKEGNSPHNMVSQLSGVKQYFHYLKQEKVVSRHPCRNLFLKGGEKRIPHDLLDRETLLEIYNGCPGEGATGKRDKLMLSLVIFQGLFKNEVLNIEPGDLDLEGGTVYVRGNGRTRARTLKLEPQQVLPFQEYKTAIRPELIREKGTGSPLLFVSRGKSINAENSLYQLLDALKSKHPELKNFQHIRMSVISHWLAEKNIRQVQYLAGHRTIVGTERYKSTDMKGLQESLEKFHPLNKKE